MPPWCIPAMHVMPISLGVMVAYRKSTSFAVRWLSVLCRVEIASVARFLKMAN